MDLWRKLRRLLASSSGARAPRAESRAFFPAYRKRRQGRSCCWPGGFVIDRPGLQMLPPIVGRRVCDRSHPAEIALPLQNARAAML
jgi:hypothetical protein